MLSDLESKTPNVSRDASWLTSLSTSVRLLLAARGGDRQALEDLFARLVPSLKRWARGRLPKWARADADTGDVVQDVLLNALTRLDAFEPRRQRALQAYLRQAIRNRVRDELRKAIRRPDAIDIESLELASNDSSPEDRALDSEREAAFQAALKSLTPAEQNFVIARMSLGYSYEQIALACGAPSPDAARMAVTRAIKKMAEHVRNE